MKALLGLTSSVLLAASALTVPAEARLLRLDLEKAEPFAGGRAFGAVGPYVRLVGAATGALDPEDPRNRVIASLGQAPRNARGLVEYRTDVFILAPADPVRGNRTILYEPPHRGRKLLLHWLEEAKATSGSAVNDPRTADDAGLSFLLRAGYTLVWSGWEPDAPRASHGMTIRVPVATERGRPIVRTVREEFVFGTRLPAMAAAASLAYEAADLDPARARLTVRAREADPPREVPAWGWAYAGSKGVKLAPEGSRFEPGLIYEFRYPAKDPKVVGIGYAATRDLVAFLRYEGRDVTPARVALAVGISQGGRFLRDYVAMGMNADESGRRVFDGVLAHAAGAGRLFANEAFAQPARTSTQHEDHHFPEHAFPFAHGRQDDPVTGRQGALLRGDGKDPLVIEVNTATEYWQKGASLLHTDPLGREDAVIPPGVRLYMIAGAPHAGRAGLTSERGSCLYPLNPLNPAAALRALTVALHRWVTEGVEPPASRLPTIAGGTLVPPAEIGFPVWSGVAAPAAGNHIAPFGDWVTPAHEPGTRYVSLVSKVDADGNEVAGIRLPDIAVPLASYTGWNVYRAPYPEGELCDREGSVFPFAKTAAERAANGDPRRSLEERYGSHAGYVAAVTAAAEALVRARLLLPEDAAAYVSRARAANPLEPLTR